MRRRRPNGDGVGALDDYFDDNNPNIYPFAGDTYGDGVNSDVMDWIACE